MKQLYFLILTVFLLVSAGASAQTDSIVFNYEIGPVVSRYPTFPVNAATDPQSLTTPLSDTISESSATTPNAVNACRPYRDVVVTVGYENNGNGFSTATITPDLSGSTMIIGQDYDTLSAFIYDRGMFVDTAFFSVASPMVRGPFSGNREDFIVYTFRVYEETTHNPGKYIDMTFSAVSFFGFPGPAVVDPSLDHYRLVVTENDPDFSSVALENVTDNSTFAVTEYLGPNMSVNFYDNIAGDDVLIGYVTNNSTHDYGCTTFEIDRVPTPFAQPYEVNDPMNYTTGKSLLFTPENPNATEDLDFTFFYTQNELEQWELATGNLLTDARILRADNAISTADTTDNTANTGEVFGSFAPMDLGGGVYMLNGTFAGTGHGFTLGDPGNTPIPVRLVDFDAFAVEEGAQLEWITMVEEHVSHFEVLKSTDNLHFESIGSVEPKAQVRNLYSFTDKEFDREAYYQLKIVFLTNEAPHLSRPVFVGSDMGQGFSVYPNPAGPDVVLEWTKPVKEAAFLRIIDVAGKTHFERNVRIGERRIQLNIDDLQKGIYLLEVNDGKGLRTKRIIKE